MSLPLRLLPFALLACAACTVNSTDNSSTSSSGNSEYNALYDVAAGSADSSNAIGLWETTITSESSGVVATSHQRIEIREGAVKLANRCSAEGYQTLTIGVTVNAQIGDGTITTQDKGGVVTETADGPSGKPPLACRVQLQGPGTLTFALGGDKLQIAGGAFTKVSD